MEPLGAHAVFMGQERSTVAIAQASLAHAMRYVTINSSAAYLGHVEKAT